MCIRDSLIPVASGSSFASACTPSGASKSLGGTTIGMYDGTSAVGKGIDIVSIFCIGGITIVGSSMLQSPLLLLLKYLHLFLNHH